MLQNRVRNIDSILLHCLLIVDAGPEGQVLIAILANVNSLMQALVLTSLLSCLTQMSRNATDYPRKSHVYLDISDNGEFRATQVEGTPS